MSRYSRRVFLTAAAGALAAPAFAAKRSATDWVTLGNSGVKVTRLAFGTGTFGGRVQRELGQAEFTRLVRYAYERGIRFFETADSYAGMPIMLANALQGLPRDSYRLMTKYKRSENGDPKLTIDRYRRDLNSEYFDIMLMHGVRNADWTDTYKRVLDQISESKVQKIVHAHGASCHGLQPLRTFPGNKWLDVALLRVNHDGARMDNLRDDVRQKGEVPEVYGHIKPWRLSLDHLLEKAAAEGMDAAQIAQAWKEKCAAKQDELDAKKLQAVLDAQAAGEELPVFGSR